MIYGLFPREGLEEALGTLHSVNDFWFCGSQCGVVTTNNFENCDMGRLYLRHALGSKQAKGGFVYLL